MPADACLKCSRPLERPKVGRPPTYCSKGCRRAAEFELRRLQRRLERLERQLEDLEIEGDPFGYKRRLKRQIKTTEERLLALLAAHPEPERVSPP